MRIFGFTINIARNRGARATPWMPTHRHRKGGEYRCMLEGQLEADLSSVVIYDDREGQVWVRSKAEFYDGRFSTIEQG